MLLSTFMLFKLDRPIELWGYELRNVTPGASYYIWLWGLCGAWVLNPGLPEDHSWSEGSPQPTEPSGNPPHLGFFLDISQIKIIEIGHLDTIQHVHLTNSHTLFPNPYRPNGYILSVARYSIIAFEAIYYEVTTSFSHHSSIKWHTICSIFIILFFLIEIRHTPRDFILSINKELLQ